MSNSLFNPGEPALVDALAGWLASATPAPRLPAPPSARLSRSESIGRWLFSPGEFSIQSAFRADHPQWSDSDWIRARDQLWLICTSLDDAMGAPKTLALLDAAYARAEKVNLPQSQEFFFWRAIVEDGASQKNLFVIEGAFPKSAVEHAVDRAPLPAFVGNLGVERRRALFSQQIILALNGATGGPDEIGRPFKARASFSPVWKLNDKSVMGALDVHQEVAQSMVPGSDALVFSFIAQIEPRGKEFSLARLRAQAKEDIEEARRLFHRVFGPSAALPILFTTVDASVRPTAEAIREFSHNCVSTGRKAEIFAEFERETLREAIRQPPRLPGARDGASVAPSNRRI